MLIKKILSSYKNFKEYNYLKTNNLKYFLKLQMDRIKYGVDFENWFGFEFYKKNKGEKEKYFTIRGRQNIERKINDHPDYILFENKALFNKTFHGFVNRDWLVVKESSKEQALTFFNNHKKVLAKPLNLLKGRGIHMLSAEKFLNSEPEYYNEYILEEIVIQSKYINSVNASCVNTIRVFTILDKYDKVHFIGSFIRFGVGGNIVDNASAGGIMVGINSETGQLNEYGSKYRNIDKYYEHPETKIKFKDLKIPKWNEFLAFVERLCLVNKNIRMVGWDIAILENGFEVIEGNHDSAESSLQIALGYGVNNIVGKIDL